ncbi:MAG TPA: ribonuclease III [Aestuariivirgaceae bacterium]
MPRTKGLAEKIGYEFKNKELLTRALTHASYGKGHDYQALEFLGDRILGLVVAEELYRRDPHMREGLLTQSLKTLVRTETLAEVARQLKLSDALRTEPRGTHTVRASSNVLADACEALIAAVYLDGGLDAARSFILRHWGSRFDDVRHDEKDAKSTLQEWTGARAMPSPVYTIIGQSGPQHDPLFVVDVAIEKYPSARGEGKTRRQAEQQAAKAFLTRTGVWVE